MIAVPSADPDYIVTMVPLLTLCDDFAKLPAMTGGGQDDQLSFALHLNRVLFLALASGKQLADITEAYTGSDPFFLAWAQIFKTQAGVEHKASLLLKEILKSLMSKPAEASAKLKVLSEYESKATVAMTPMLTTARFLVTSSTVLDEDLKAEGPALGAALKTYIQLQPIEPKMFKDLSGNTVFSKVTTWIQTFEQRLSEFHGNIPDITASLAGECKQLLSLLLH